MCISAYAQAIGLLDEAYAWLSKAMELVDDPARRLSIVLALMLLFLQTNSFDKVSLSR